MRKKIETNSGAEEVKKPAPKKRIPKKVTKPETETSVEETTPVTEATEEKKEIKAEEMTVADYFNLVKSLKRETDSEYARNMLETCENMIKRFEVLGQQEAAKKAVLAAKALKKDLELYEKGIRTYIHIDDITKYIKEMKKDNKKPLKLIELKNFPRIVPDEVVDKWLPVREYFDEAFVLFTDYTEKSEEKNTVAAAMGKQSTQAEVEKKRKEKDPILFGAIKVDSERNTLKGNCYEKMYFIADWVDDYCDLTFDKLLERLTEEGKEDMVKEITPVDSPEDFRKLAGL